MYKVFHNSAHRFNNCAYLSKRNSLFAKVYLRENMPKNIHHGVSNDSIMHPSTSNFNL